MDKYSVQSRQDLLAHRDKVFGEGGAWEGGGGRGWMGVNGTGSVGREGRRIGMGPGQGRNIGMRQMRHERIEMGQAADQNQDKGQGFGREEPCAEDGRDTRGEGLLDGRDIMAPPYKDSLLKDIR